MTTAHEIELMMKAAQHKLSALARSFEAKQQDIVGAGLHLAFGRNVSAARARRLRRRGEDVRYIGRTETGKARYRWWIRINPFSIYKESKP